MKREFKEWYNVRANVINEVNPFSAAYQGVKNWAARPMQQMVNDPQSMINRPHVYKDALNQSKKYLDQFSERLGFQGLADRDPHINDSLLRIIAARVYGPRDENDNQPVGGAVQEGDLEYIWRALQRKNKKGKTLAQIKGISRPRVIITLVPVPNPNALWNWTRDAAQFDINAANQAAMAAQQDNAPNPQPGDNAQSTLPIDPNKKMPPSPNSGGGQAVANELKSRYQALESKKASGGKLNRTEKQMMATLAYLYHVYTGRDL